MGRRLLATVVPPVLAVVLFGCDGPNGIYYPDSDPTDGGDGGEGGPADAGCRFDSQCDDGIECTVDLCDTSTGLCDHTPEHQRCHDELRCNGFEFCDSQLGCQAGIPNQECNDNVACTIDNCLEPATPGGPVACEHLPMDRDGDGHVDYHCPADPVGDPEGPMGDDCDDLDPYRYPGAGEFCFDGIDNDCDFEIDGDDDDCLLWNDTCEGAIELLPGRLREGFTFGAGGETDMSCGWSGYPDVAYFFVLEEAADVTLEVWGRDYYYPMVAIQTVCGSRASELRCLSGSTSTQFFARGMEPGTYYVVVESWSEGVFDLLLSVDPVTEPPEGEDCSDPLAIAVGTRTRIDLGEFESDVPLGCASSTSYPDAVLAFALSEARDVRYEVTASGLTPYVGVRTVCEDSRTEIGCYGGNPLARTLCAVPAGTHYMVVRGSRGGVVDLQVTTAPPSARPPNDLCAGAIDVSAGGTFSGTLLCSEGDYRLSCEWWQNHDVVYSLTLAEERDVELALRPEDGLWASLGVLQGCGAGASELFCSRDDAPGRLLRGLGPGTYSIVVAGEFAAGFELDVTVRSPTSACDGATIITGSTVISDSTAGRSADMTTTCGGRGEGADIPYLLDIAYAFDLRAEVTSAPFDTVLHLRRDCDDPSSEIECNDDGGAGVLSLIDRRGLPAGEYVLVMDGFWLGAEGPFTLALDVTPVDPCSAAAAVSGSATLTGDTCAFAGSHAGTCGGAGAAESVHRVDLAATSDLHAAVTSASFEPVLYLRSACGTAGTELACDPGSGAALPVLEAAGLAPGSYFLLVDGETAGACGTYAIDLTLTAP